MKPDLLPHEADAWLKSCRAPLFPTTVYPTEEELRRHRELQQKHLSDNRALFGRRPGFDPDVDNDDDGAFHGIRDFLAFIVVLLVLGLCTAVGVGAGIWAIGG